MAPKKIKCKDCGKEFELKTTGRYARKYCEKCGKQRKKDYDNLWRAKIGDGGDED